MMITWFEKISITHHSPRGGFSLEWLEQMGVEPISNTIHFGFKYCRNHSCPKIFEGDCSITLKFK